jgi:hypothetical protein
MFSTVSQSVPVVDEKVFEFAGIVLPINMHFPNVGPCWPLMTPGNHLFHVFFGSFKNGLNASIPSIFHPSRKVYGPCLIPGVCSKVYTLNHPADNDMGPDHGHNDSPLLRWCWLLFRLFLIVFSLFLFSNISSGAIWGHSFLPCQVKNANRK